MLLHCTEVLHINLPMTVCLLVNDISHLGSVSSNCNPCNIKDYDKNSSDPRLVLENQKFKNNHRLVVRDLNINFKSNKFDNLILIIQDKIDI